MRSARTVVLCLTVALALATSACAEPSTSDAPSTAPTDAGPNAVDPAELRYTCGTFPFDPAVVADAPGTAEQGADPLATALREQLAKNEDGGFLPDAGWHLAGANAQFAEFVAVGGANGMFHISFEQGSDGWQVTGWGDCIAQLDLPAGLGPAMWSLDPAERPPDASTQVFDALVTELACTGGASADGRVVGPRMAATPDSVLVIFAVQSMAGIATCPGNPPTRVTVDLGEPLGDRTLLDGGRYPLGDPAEPGF